MRPAVRLSRRAVVGLAAGIGLFLVAPDAWAQQSFGLPVIVLMPAGQQATTLQITNSGKTDINVQISALSFQPPDGTEVLMPPDTVLISPPVAAIAPDATQAVRLVLSHPRQAKIGTYRVLLGSSYDLGVRATEPKVRFSLRSTEVCRQEMNA